MAAPSTPARHGSTLAEAAQINWQPSFGLCLGVAWLLAATQLLAQDWALTAASMHDADDALRLVQVRSFIAGRGWFDLHEARLGPPLGYDSHWSRLIDAGLAGVFFLFNAFLDRSMAERLMEAFWPVLWLIPAIGGAAAIAWRIAGRQAAFILLLFAIFGTSTMGQFRPGRIDHHNVQIALAVLSVAATVWLDRRRWCAFAAGASTGLALAIGLESLDVLALCGAAFALLFVIDGNAASALRAYGLSLAASTLGAFLVTVAPEHWARSVCDELAINTAASVIAGGTGLWLAATRFAHARGTIRGAAVGAAAALTAAIYIALEPRCLGGPYAMVDPAILPIWFSNIAENQSLAVLLKLGPLSGVALAAFPAVALVAVAVLLASPDRVRDFGCLAASAAFLCSCAIMVVVTKAGSYTLWLGMPVVAAAAADLYPRLKLKGLLPRFLVSLLLTPTAITVGAIEVATAAGAQALEVNTPAHQACIHKDNYAVLARLPPGLVVANELEWGSFVLAWTPHSVLAGPYHRMESSILTWYRVFTGRPDEARQFLHDIGADYVAICGRQGDRERPASLLGRLQAGDFPDWLEPIPASRGQVFAIYRVRR